MAKFNTLKAAKITGMTGAVAVPTGLGISKEVKAEKNPEVPNILFPKDADEANRTHAIDKVSLEGRLAEATQKAAKEEREKEEVKNTLKETEKKLEAKERELEEEKAKLRIYEDTEVNLAPCEQLEHNVDGKEDYQDLNEKLIKAGIDVNDAGDLDALLRAKAANEEMGKELNKTKEDFQNTLNQLAPKEEEITKLKREKEILTKEVKKLTEIVSKYEDNNPTEPKSGCGASKFKDEEKYGMNCKNVKLVGRDGKEREVEEFMGVAKPGSQTEKFVKSLIGVTFK